MTNQLKIHQAISVFQKQISRDQKSECPDDSILMHLMEEAPKSVVTHVAFCHKCQQKLQILNTGKVYIHRELEPDWDSLIKRLRRNARWDKLKTQISSVFNTPFTLFPDLITSTTRSLETSPLSITLTIFEVNLTIHKKLSNHGLRIILPPVSSGQEDDCLEICGFVPELNGADARLGIASRRSFLRACDQRVGSLDWDLTHIEQRLQKSFTRKNSPSKRLNKLINESIWVQGTIQSDSDTNETVLSITLREEHLGLLSRTDVWVMLLVGDRSSVHINH